MFEFVLIFVISNYTVMNNFVYMYFVNAQVYLYSNLSK